MRCRGLESSLCLVLAAVATAGCAGLPDARSLMPGGTAKANQTLESQLALARLSERHGDTRTAEQIYTKVLQKDPGNQLALHRLGVLAARIGENEKAAEHLEAAARLGPPSSELLNDIGFNLFAMRRLPEAEAAFRQAIAADPQNKAARNNLGLVLGETQRYEESLAEFRRASSEAEAHANLAYAKSQAGDLQGAQSSYHRALTLDKELKPAAEALIQLAQQRASARASDPHAPEAGQPGGPGAGDRRRAGASGDRTLAELIRGGKTAEFLESVTERDRTSGREQTFRSPAEAAQVISPAAYFAEQPAAGRDAVRRRAETQAAGRHPIGQAERRSSLRGSPTAATGGTFVLSRIFRFPDQAASETLPAAELRTTLLHEPASPSPPDSPRQPGLSRKLANQETSTTASRSLTQGPPRDVVEPSPVFRRVPPSPEEADVVESSAMRSALRQRPAPRGTQGHQGNRLSSFDPRAGRQPQAAPAAAGVPTAQATPPAETRNPAPPEAISPAVQTAAFSPWQAPTWTPDFAGLHAAAMSSPAAPPAALAPAALAAPAVQLPTPPLVNRQP